MNIPRKTKIYLITLVLALIAVTLYMRRHPDSPLPGLTSSAMVLVPFALVSLRLEKS